MSALDRVRERLPEAAKDIKVNLQTVLGDSSLTAPQKWGVAIASALAARNVELRDALLEAATAAGAEPALLEDARAAAVLMGMTNVYYRFRHMIGKESYASKPPRLRMQRLGQVATNKVDFELLCLAVSAVNGCEQCVRSHEQVVIQGGLSEDQVNDAIRVASVVHAAAVALELA